MRLLRTRKRPFTLLEVMVAIAILALVGGAVGWKMARVMEERRLRSELTRLRSHFFTCHHLALNMQSNWKGVFEREGKGWKFSARCVEQPKIPPLLPLQLSPFSLSFNGERRESFSLDFCSNGETFPSGVLSFSQKMKKEEWKLPELFQREKGSRSEKKRAPLHPSET